MILRRVQLADGRTRAFINDQPISVQTLKAVGAALVEIHGQHDERALVDAATHRRLLDAFAGLEKDVAARRSARGTRAAPPTADAGRASRRHGARRARGRLSAPRRPTNSKQLAPQDGEETALADAPHRHDAGREDRRRSARGAGGGRRPAFAGAGAVGRGAPAGAPRRAGAGAGRARGEGDRCRDQRAGGGATSISRPRLRAADFDPAELERIEERLFALRAAVAQIFDVRSTTSRRWPRKYAADRRADRCRRRAAEEAGSRPRSRPTRAMRRPPQSCPRRAQKAAAKLDKAVNAELPPLKLERARFITQVETDEAAPGRKASTASSSGCRPIRARGRGR